MTTYITMPDELRGATSIKSLFTFDAGLTVASGQTLTLTGTTVAGAPTWSSGQTFPSIVTSDLDYAGTLNIGATNATTINIGRAGQTVNLLGAVNNINATNVNVPNDLDVDGLITADGGIDRSGAATLELGVTNANAVSISRTGIVTTVNGGLAITQATTATGVVYAEGGIDRNSATTLSIGVTNATAITISKAGSTTTVQGNLTVNDLATLGDSAYTGQHIAQGSVIPFKVQPSSATGGTTAGISLNDYSILEAGSGIAARLRVTDSTRTTTYGTCSTAGLWSFGVASTTTGSHVFNGGVTAIKVVPNSGTTCGISLNDYGIIEAGSGIAARFRVMDSTRTTTYLSLGSTGYMSWGPNTGPSFAVVKITDTWTANTALYAVNHGIADGTVIDRIKYVAGSIDDDGGTPHSVPGVVVTASGNRHVQVTHTATQVIMYSYDSSLSSVALDTTNALTFVLYIYYEAS